MTAKSFMAMAREAQAKGLKTFDPGVPCARGHISHRYAYHPACVECMRIADAAKTEKLRNKVKEKTAPYADRIVTRNFAIENGLQRYFTGLPCPHGHVSERYVAGFGCVDCSMLSYWRNSKSPRKQFLTKLEDGTYTGHPCRVCGDTRRNKTKQCPSCVIRIEKESWETRTASRLARKARDLEGWKERTGISRRKSRANNPAASNIYRGKRKQCKPAWIDDAHEKKIRSFYRKRKNGEHVDHIVPLLGKNVCGLHVWWNLQILSAFDNVSKGSKFPYCQKSMQPACFDAPE